MLKYLHHTLVYAESDVELQYSKNRRSFIPEIYNQLKEIVHRLGIPNIVGSDNGSQFTSYIYKQFANDFNFERVYFNALHTQSNGQVE